MSLRDIEDWRGAEQFASSGVAVIEAVVPLPTVVRLRALRELAVADRPGRRAFSLAPEVANLIAPEAALTRLATDLMGQTARPVRVLYFDKRPGVNWAVPWHQDRTIGVARRIDAPGYETWSVKAGAHHVEAPEAILQGMVAIRLHIDDCGADNGPLLTVRGSFRSGRIAASEIATHVGRGTIDICCANSGDVVAMRGLTIHASERALRPAHRRVIHVDYSTVKLPAGLEWALPRCQTLRV